MKTGATIFSLCSFLFIAGAQAQDIPEVEVTKEDRTGLALTIYNGGFAQVLDQRHVALGAGRTRLLFSDVAPKMDAESALLTTDALSIIEKNFDYDLLSPDKLLVASIGEEVFVIRGKDENGEDKYELGTLLSVTDLNNFGSNVAVVEVGDRIETIALSSAYSSSSIRLAFKGLPEGFLRKPTLSMTVSNQASFDGETNLAYLADGIGWQADYVAYLASDETSLELKGWITINNQSGMDFTNSKISAVAGTINRSQAKWNLQRRVDNRSYSISGGAMSQAPVFSEYHEYILPERTTILNNQTKQVAFLERDSVRVNKVLSYLTFSQLIYNSANDDQLQPMNVVYEIGNKEDQGLGAPLPEGIFRVYKTDADGNPRFIGDNQIPHTPKGEMVKVAVGKAFDVTFREKVSNLAQEGTGISQPRSRIYNATVTVSFSNAKDEPASVRYGVQFGGNWSVEKESLPHEKTSAATAEWEILIPANRTRDLTFTIREEIF